MRSFGSQKVAETLCDYSGFFESDRFLQAEVLPEVGLS
jgi:hypothetical protein